MTTQANKHVCHILHRISIQPHPALTRFCGQKQKNPYPTSKKFDLHDRGNIESIQEKADQSAKIMCWPGIHYF